MIITIQSTSKGYVVTWEKLGILFKTLSKATYVAQSLSDCKFQITKIRPTIKILPVKKLKVTKKTK